jgi:PAS domain S-box-containing protein
MNATTGDDLAQALFHQSGDALFLFDPATERVLDANVMALRLTNLPRADLVGMQAHQLFRLVEKSNKPGVPATNRNGIYPPHHGYFLRTRQPDVWIPVQLTIAQLNVAPTPVGLITVRDLRARREAHAELVRKENELHQLLTASSDCFWHAVIRAKGEWVYRSFSPLVQQITGFPEKHFLPGLYRWWHIVYPSDRPRCEQLVRRLRAGMSSQAIYRVMAPDGGIRWLRDHVQVNRSADGSCLELHGRLTDITDRRRAEEAFQLREAMLQALPSGVFLIDPARPGQPIVCANRSLETLTGRASSAILEHSWRAVLGVDSTTAGFEDLDRSLRERRRGMMVVNVTTLDGTRTQRTISLTPLCDQQGKLQYFIGVVSDGPSGMPRASADCLTDTPSSLAATRTVDHAPTIAVNDPVIEIAEPEEQAESWE